MRRSYLALLSLVAVSACSDHGPPWTVISDEQVKARILYIDSPKHFWVNIDVNGTIYNHVGSSKHCNLWRQNNVGDVITTRLIRYGRKNRQGGTDYSVAFPTLNYQLCSPR